MNLSKMPRLYSRKNIFQKIKKDPSIIEAFNGKRYFFEKENTNKMNNYIKKPFIQEYSKTLNKETNGMLDIV